MPNSLPIQKILAFSGAFEILLKVIEHEGGIEGAGVVVQDALGVLSVLLKGNLSNQVCSSFLSLLPHPSLLSYLRYYLLVLIDILRGISPPDTTEFVNVPTGPDSSVGICHSPGIRTSVLDKGEGGSR